MINNIFIKIVFLLPLIFMSVYANGIEIQEVNKKTIFDDKQNFQKQIFDSISKNLIYPKTSMRLKQSGTVMVGFTITVPNKVHNIHIISTSGFPQLDEAAIKAIEKSQEDFPVVERELLIKVPFEFRLH
ncbi:MAG: energy transducer TonB [Arcobacteraceae bacterium]|nr:energy transducer TonB [Arcobacteraceae bacterium]